MYTIIKIDWVMYIVSRQDNVLNMQITLVKIMSKEWNISYSDLSDILNKYHVLKFIDIAYERFNSTGELGILDL